MLVTSELFHSSIYLLAVYSTTLEYYNLTDPTNVTLRVEIYLKVMELKLHNFQLRTIIKTQLLFKLRFLITNLCYNDNASNITFLYVKTNSASITVFKYVNDITTTEATNIPGQSTP